ncbi:MAG: MBL fold metallo-hydrolase [Lachnospiraceae bacterium]
MAMRIESLQVGYICENCYLVIHEERKEALIIDPGDEAKRIMEKLEEGQITPVAILLTHGHYDHTGAMNALRERYGIKAYTSREERRVLEDTRLSMHSKVLHADEYWEDGHVFKLAGFTGQMIATPGHTPGGVCYYFPEEKVLFSGDSLFLESVGRTDFPEGSMQSLVRSIREKLFVLPDDVAVFPGHMEATTIGHEKAYNPFIA